MPHCVREFKRATGALQTFHQDSLPLWGLSAIVSLAPSHPLPSGCTAAEALKAASLHPAQALGLKHKGSLEPGADADLVLLDKGLNVRATFVGGELAWMAPGAGLEFDGMT